MFAKVLDTHVIEIDSFLVGVFGVCTQDTPQLSNPTENVIFEDCLSHAARCTDYLRSQLLCDVVVALTHVPLEFDKKIAEIKGIDYIIGGHDHEPYLLTVQGTLIVKCGQNLDHLGIIDIDMERGPRGVSLSHSFQLLSTKRETRSDLDIDALIVEWSSSFQNATDSEVLCTVGV